MSDNHKIPTRNLLDKILSESSDVILAQKRIKKARVNSNISEDTHQKFLDFVKKRHDGLVKGPYSYELERAMLFYLHFYDI